MTVICMHAAQLIIAYLVIHYSDGAISCTDDGITWKFTRCSWVTPMYVIHVFVTMQTAAIPRAVFVKTAKKTSYKHEFRGVR